MRDESSLSHQHLSGSVRRLNGTEPPHSLRGPHCRAAIQWGADDARRCSVRPCKKPWDRACLLLHDNRRTESFARQALRTLPGAPAPHATATLEVFCRPTNKKSPNVTLSLTDGSVPIDLTGPGRRSHLRMDCTRPVEEEVRLEWLTGEARAERPPEAEASTPVAPGVLRISGDERKASRYQRRHQVRAEESRQGPPGVAPS